MFTRLTLRNASFITVVNAAQISVNSSGPRLIIPQRLGHSALYTIILHRALYYNYTI
jgi:hypothetical protein